MSLTTRQIDALIDAVRDTGRREIMPYFRNLSPQAISTKVDAKDLVTDADRAAERAITAAVSKILPHAVVVGEEAVADRPEVQNLIATADTTVIVDPIDGTGNFVSGLAIFGTILAVVEKGETIFGLLYDPVLDDWIVGVRGGGAFFSSETVAAHPVMSGASRRLETARGFLPLDNYAAAERAIVMQTFAPVYQIQAIRCSCHEYRLVAAGEADFLVSASLNPWDHAAGLLVVNEAGGWSQVDGHRDYAPTLRHGSVIAASCQSVGECVRDLSKCVT
ncbi:inositol monophosphatase family protein [Aliiruegeria lutimaris]|uniref:Fructose-1,6-bisphosphatase n=1 Tax=Aliiruegeria lutimaris TaxID=571298 RepID=A0A1G9FED0_9RHOB|nr:inositol monophosphatase [Aliiruegeria lutimaris]SDK86785.1 fructose-1,6-bisphosphatase [Aliiruegeria lutimaris]